MNISGKTFVFIFGAIFLAIVLGGMAAKHIENKVSLAKASAKSNQAAQEAGVTA